MGTPGVPFNIDKATIVETIKKRKGVITHICKDLHVCHGTMLKHINLDPELKELLDETRHEFSESLCDMAENTLAFAMNNRDTDPGNALGSAKFILNNLGKKRGYAPRSENNAESSGVIPAGTIDEIYHEPRDGSIKKSPLADESSLLDQEFRRKEAKVRDELGTETTMGGSP